MPFRVTTLVWDEWNVEHIKNHQVSVREVEEACESKTKTKEAGGGRLFVFGKTKQGRRLIVVVSPKREKHSYYPVTARDMSRKERRWYESD